MYMGLEIFPNPGCAVVQLEFDELMCKCPITGQPDWYSGTIVLAATDNLIESKSLKLFFHNIIESTFTKNMGLFGEALAVYIRDQLREALDAEENEVHVILKQKSRGGISITAHA
jgi:7-cyano-7-deazaguanine reductase